MRAARLVPVLAVLACAPVAQADEPPSTPCPLAGCSSGVAVAVPDAARTGSLTVCVNDTCRRFSGKGDAVRLVDEHLAASHARVRVVVRDRRGRVVLRVDQRVALKRLTPNGKDCPPACWWRSLRLDGRRLVPAAG
jgi:hypothetical protein